MKFAKQLGLRSIPSWAPYYLDYKSLKGYIKSSFKDVAGKFFHLQRCT
jgi:SPX domain protein involved in polyphosphate accumulation